MANYTKYNALDLKKILQKYGIEYNSHSPINGGMANTSYIINEKFVLTALDNHEERSAEQLAKIMRHLSENKFETPQPIRDKNAKDIVFYKSRPVLLKPYLKTTSQPTTENFRTLSMGKLLAQLHMVPIPNFLDGLGRRIPADALDVLSDYDCPDLKAALRLVSQARYDELFDKYAIALCHGDLMEDNILELENGAFVAIDWETVTIDSPILDLGIAAVSAVKQNESVNAFAKSLLGGYQEEIDSEISTNEVILATAYACALMAYHRFIRQNIEFPCPDKALIYQQLIPFIFETLET